MSARHILGGTVAYQVVNNGSQFAIVDIDFTIIRNANGGGANFDSPANFGVYGVKNNTYTYLTATLVNPSNMEVLDLDYPEFCPELSYEKAIYSFEVGLPKTSYDYFVISHQRCCRDAGVSNIINPEESGFALSVTLYSNAFEAMERAFELSTSSMPFLLNSMEEHELDLSIDDPFTKEYLLTTPTTAGGIAGVTFGDPEACDGIVPNPENCPPPYGVVQYIDDANPYGINSEVNLDKMNGEFNVSIPNVGITLFELTVNRFEDGELLSSVNSQWMTTTSTCEEALSTGDNLSDEEVKLAPNPASNTIYSSSTLKDVVIYDLLGNKVLSIERMEKNKEISILDLSSGLYMLKGAKEDGELVNLQFIKSN